MPHIYGVNGAGASYLAAATQVARQAAASAAAVDEQGRFPQEAVQELAAQGFFGLCVPLEFGGQEQPPGVFAAVVEELAQACASTAMIYVMHVTASQAIVASGVLAERDALLREIAAGRHLSTLAFSERGSRSQFWAPVSKLETISDAGGYRTTAQKSWVTSAGHADSYVSSGQIPGASSPLESVLYLVRRDSLGMQLQESFNGLGLRGNDSAAVHLNQTPISAGELLTELGRGPDMMLETVLPWFSMGTAAMSHGLCRAAVTLTAEHLSKGQFEHTQTALRDLPNLRGRLAEMSVRTEQSRALLGHALASMQQPDEQTPLYILQARLAAIGAALEVSDLGMRACGGAAYSKQLPIERLFRDARAGWIMAPTADQLSDFIGRALTGLPMF
jgi:alkylation response protein AidB-like acyl-CoA dehydrogenase